MPVVGRLIECKKWWKLHSVTHETSCHLLTATRKNFMQRRPAVLLLIVEFINLTLDCLSGLFSTNKYGWHRRFTHILYIQVWLSHHWCSCLVLQIMLNPIANGSCPPVALNMMFSFFLNLILDELTYTASCSVFDCHQRSEPPDYFSHFHDIGILPPSLTRQ